jgi:hypothetical protein
MMTLFARLIDQQHQERRKDKLASDHDANATDNADQNVAPIGPTTACTGKSTH